MQKHFRSFARISLATAALAAMAAVLPGRATAQAASFVVVVNVTNPMSNIPKSELAALFTKKTQEWEDGTAVFPVDLPDDDPTREAFTEVVHGKSPRAIRAYWQQQIFAGRQVPPPERSSDEQVLAYVRSTVGAVGYVRATARLGPGVKVVGLISR
jgi:ABC-type phosphate transport system substrate-binding protein